MENAKKRKTTEPSTSEKDDKRYKFPENNSEEDDLIMEFLMLDEETAVELSKLLDVETETPPVKVKFIDNPYTTQMVFQSSAAYVTINGNEEMCGSSFSESESSLMASVDMAGLRRWEGEGSSGAWEVEEAREGGGVEEWCADVEGFLVNEGFDDVEGGNNEEEMWMTFLGEDFFGFY
ncbi:hypothetical protein LIER_34145 [Lithospermum erythrorhizon]|uniref:Uncharacterized protein n=1 Tax=Lithospermum erythrorhizon TaxID=34254 RepID=A0AAV3S2C1_LITER